MTIFTCLCHFPDGTDAIREVDGDPFIRGSELRLDGEASQWYVLKHTPTTGVIEETIAQPFDAEIWLGREAPPPPDSP